MLSLTQWVDGHVKPKNKKSGQHSAKDKKEKKKKWQRESWAEKTEKKKKEERRRRKKEEEEEEEEGVVTDFFSFLVIYSCWPKLVYRPKLAGMTKTRRNFFRGGTRGFLIPVCTPVRDFLAGTERYIQLWLIYATHP